MLVKDLLELTWPLFTPSERLYLVITQTTYNASLSIAGMAFFYYAIWILTVSHDKLSRYSRDNCSVSSYAMSLRNNFDQIWRLKFYYSFMKTIYAIKRNQNVFFYSDSNLDVFYRYKVFRILADMKWYSDEVAFSALFGFIIHFNVALWTIYIHWMVILFCAI